jgi:hypothetical protein
MLHRLQAVASGTALTGALAEVKSRVRGGSGREGGHLRGATRGDFSLGIGLEPSPMLRWLLRVEKACFESLPTLVSN